MSEIYNGTIQKFVNGKVISEEKCKVDVSGQYPAIIRNITQADKIRSMSDEELAEELSNFAWDNEPTKEEVLKWLKSEVEE